MSNVWQQLVDAFAGLLQSIVAWTPRVVVGLVLVIFALLIAKLVERLIRALLVRVKFDSALGKVGIDGALQRIGVRQQMTELLPRIVYWLLIILFAKTAADSFGLVAVSGAIGAFVAYLPNVIAAILILILGSAAAQFAGRAVADSAESSGIEFAGSLGGVVSGVLLFVIGIMAIAQLKIDTEIVRLVTTGLLAAVALAFGLSFGLGSRDITRNIMAGFYARKTFRIGEMLEVAGERGTLAAITPTQTLLERDGQTVAVANSVFLEQVVKQ